MRYIIIMLLAVSIFCACSDDKKEKVEKPNLISPENEFVFEISEVSFEWSSMSEAVEYQLLIVEKSVDEDTLIDTTISRTNFDTGESYLPGIYYWKVRTLSGSGEYGEWSSESYFSVLPERFVHEFVPANNSGILAGVPVGTGTDNSNVFRKEIFVTVKRENPDLRIGRAYATNIEDYEIDYVIPVMNISSKKLENIHSDTVGCYNSEGDIISKRRYPGGYVFGCYIDLHNSCLYPGQIGFILGSKMRISDDINIFSEVFEIEMDSLFASVTHETLNEISVQPKYYSYDHPTLEILIENEGNKEVHIGYSGSWFLLIDENNIPLYWKTLRYGENWEDGMLQAGESNKLLDTEFEFNGIASKMIVLVDYIEGNNKQY